MDKKIQNLIKELDQNPDFTFVKNLAKEVSKAHIFIVGGAVRDAMLGKEIKDFDFVITGLEKQELENFLKKYGQVFDVDSRAFGVFKFQPKGYKGEPIDVALPRKERQIGQGYKDFKVETSASLGISDDLSRRDFTINSIAIDMKNQEIVDPFDGSDDLNKKIIRAVGKPEERFLEDPSRILRAIRFACQLDFQIEKKTLKAIQSLATEIIKKFKDKAGHKKTRVAPEVIASEFLKGFDKNSIRLIELYNQTGILAQILPELENLKGVEQPPQFHSEGDVWEHTILTLRNLKPDANINVKLAGLFHDIGKPATQKTPEKHGTDRIRFHEHDEEGTKLFKKINNRLKFSAPFGQDSPIHVDVHEASWLIKNHMICTGTNPEKMRPGTIEKYFFKNGQKTKQGKHLLELSAADIAATISTAGKSDFTAFNKLIERINEVDKLFKKQEKDKKEAKKIPFIIDGYGVQKFFGIKPGPEVGRIKDIIRYLQLEGELKTLKDVLSNKELILKSLEGSEKTEDAVSQYFKLKE